MANIMDESAWAEFGEQDFEMNGVRFRIEKMKSMEGWAMGLKILNKLGLSMNFLTSDAFNENMNDLQAMMMLFQSVLTLPPEFVDQVRAALFERVTFQKEGESPRKLGGAEPMVFDEGFFEVLEVFARCLVVNFTPSSRVKGLFRTLLTFDTTSPVPETSSSPESSVLDFARTPTAGID